jgi:hypothetical protein
MNVPSTPLDCFDVHERPTLPAPIPRIDRMSESFFVAGQVQSEEAWALRLRQSILRLLVLAICAACSVLVFTALALALT